MNIDIRENIISNFKDGTLYDLKESIIDAVSNKEEIVLPGLGVLFEILWNNSNESLKNNILNNIYNKIKN